MKASCASRIVGVMIAKVGQSFAMSLHKQDIQEIVGKTIKSVITSENRLAEPHCLLILVFTDDTYYEFYGGDIHATNGLTIGDEEAAMHYLAGGGGKVTKYC